MSDSLAKLKERREKLAERLKTLDREIRARERASEQRVFLQYAKKLADLHKAGQLPRNLVKLLEADTAAEG